MHRSKYLWGKCKATLGRNSGLRSIHQGSSYFIFFFFFCFYSPVWSRLTKRIQDTWSLGPACQQRSWGHRCWREDIEDMSGCEAHSCKEVESWWLLPISSSASPSCLPFWACSRWHCQGNPSSALPSWSFQVHHTVNAILFLYMMIFFGNVRSSLYKEGLKRGCGFVFRAIHLFISALSVWMRLTLQTPLFWCGQRRFLPDGWGSPHEAVEHHTSLPAPLSTMSGLGWNFALLTQVPFLPFGALGCEYPIIAQRELGKNVLGKIRSDGWEEGGNQLYKVNASHKCVGGIVPVRTSVRAWGFCGFGKCAWPRGQMEAETSWCSTYQAALWRVLTQGSGHLEGQVTSSFTGRISPSAMQST